ncbi:MAG: ABC transporter ATP-binding protein [Pyramidobacter sp.]|jgi:ABC-2 type transport system ATP-binding protein
MNAIEVNNVAKCFKVYYDKNRTLKERLLFLNRNHYEERWVLKDISFQVGRGEAVGLIGENGCGKSTTLKLLSRILYPDRGTISINGRLSCLIELGAGFHPDLNGIENIYLNAAMFGMKRRETAKKLDEIIAFSELGTAIENPIRTYSSGMYMRLAFSVAINVDAEVLLIDEILAVGDMNFQAKCFEKLKEIKKNGTTIVIVSHSMGQIESICDRSIWISGGLVRAEGPAAETDRQYLEYMEAKRAAQQNG